MFTQCPRCGTVFSVGDQQLDAAAGRVRCGACGAPFDALLYLVRQLPTGAPAAAAPQRPGREGQTGTARAAPARPRPSVPPPEPPRPPPPRVQSPRAAPLPQAPAATARPPVAPPMARASAGVAAAPGVPEPLRADAEEAGRRLSPVWAGLLQSVVALGLVALLAFQLAWLAPAEVLARVPSARPWMDQLGPAFDRASALVGWERASPPRDLGRIRVRERDIREHPQHPGALLVLATLVNDAPFPQPPPRVRLTLFDVNGAVLAQRVFAPEEYLTGDPPSPGLWPLRLEVLAPESPAVSYQIEFL